MMPANEIIGVNPERFWEKVERVSSDGCWEWKACKRGDGYGVIKCRGGKMWWDRPRGSDLVIDHTCFNNVRRYHECLSIPIRYAEGGTGTRGVSLAGSAIVRIN